MKKEHLIPDLIVSLDPPKELRAAVPATASSVKAIDRAVNHLKELPDREPDAVNQILPNLQGHILEAKENGKRWGEVTRPAVLSALMSIVKFSDVFNAHYDVLIKLCENFNNENLEKFKAELIELQISTREQASLVLSVQSEINAFDLLIATDARNFNADAQQAQIALSNAQAMVALTDKQIEELEAERKKKIKKRRALLILGPIAWALDRAIAALTGQIKKAKEIKQKAEEESKKAKEALKSANLALSAVSDFQSAEADIGASTNALMNGWEVLYSNFNVLIESEDITVFNAFTPDMLEAIRLNWEDLAQQVKDLAGI